MKVYNKIIYVGDLTVEDYLLFMTDEREAFFKVLKEFNSKIPKMNKYQQEALMKFLFSMTDDEIGKAQSMTEKQKQKKASENKTLIADFHIFVGMLCHHLNLQYSEIMKMPKDRFSKLMADLPVIIGSQKYDKDRNSKTPDKKALNRVMGGKTVLTDK